MQTLIVPGSISSALRACMHRFLSHTTYIFPIRLTQKNPVPGFPASQQSRLFMSLFAPAAQYLPLRNSIRIFKINTNEKNDRLLIKPCRPCVKHSGFKPLTSTMRMQRAGAVRTSIPHTGQLHLSKSSAIVRTPIYCSYSANGSASPNESIYCSCTNELLENMVHKSSISGKAMALDAAQVFLYECG